MLSGAGVVPGALLALHGEYGMANAVLGIQNALSPCKDSSSGIGELFGGALFGKGGANVGSVIDMISNVSGLVKGAKGILGSNSVSDAINYAPDILGGANSIGKSFGNNGGKQ